MRPVLNAEQMRVFDAHQIERGVESLILMENAGRGAAHLIGLKLRPRTQGQQPRTGSSVVGACIRCADEKSLGGAAVVVLCGPGNNGGDGYSVARHLLARGVSLQVFSTVPVEQLRGDAQTMHRALLALGVIVHPAYSKECISAVAGCDVVVDALLGTGTSRPVSGQLAQLIEQVNEQKPYVVALDVPSGLDASTGNAWGPVIKAQHTVCFAHLKSGLLTTLGHAFGGNITVSHIGVPSELPEKIVPSVYLLEESDLRKRAVPREKIAHKGDAGRVVVIAGSSGTLGAARLVGRAALRGGAGLVTLFNHPDVIAHFSGEVAELMTHPSAEDSSSERDVNVLAKADSLVVGPGLGRSAYARGAILAALSAGKPTVLDADALRFIAAEGRELYLSGEFGAHCVMTPHPAEAADLLGVTTAQVEADRFGAVQKLAQDFSTTVLLKGSRPLISAPGQATCVSAFGTPALATGGSGDVLAGILGALLVRASTPELIFERTLLAVGMQGLAAESWSETHGEQGLLASEIGDLIPDVQKRLQG